MGWSYLKWELNNSLISIDKQNSIGMKQKDLNNWFMYHKIHQLSRLGFTASKIAKYLSLDNRTVKKHLQMSDQEYESYLLKTQSRIKILSPYENFVRDKLQKFPDTSSAQIQA